MYMHAPALIEKKRDGGALTDQEISWLVEGLVSGAVPEYQWAALAMAIYFQGMNDRETAALTLSMRDSGTVLHHPSARPTVVDKHSTGGIGDKTSLVLAPLLACCGVWCPMVSGRGLGITGGTLDKLESIPGFRVSLSEQEMAAQLASIGVFMAGQTAAFCPADRKLYALRDVTATVPSIPLITASILSKKLAESLDRLVLDVKYGRGAFMPTREKAEALAASLQRVGEAAGVSVTAQLNPMDEPLGRSVGNAVEVQEALECLEGRGPKDLEDLTLELASAVVDTPRATLQAFLRNGTAKARFEQMVTAQGGDLAAFHARPPAPHCGTVFAKHEITLAKCDALILGQIVVALGGGRQKATDSVAHGVGLTGLRKVGEKVRAGEPLVTIHAHSAEALAQATSLAETAFA